MYKPQFHLMKARRFLPIFCTQFLGAFNDNVFKQALIMMITYQIGLIGGGNSDKMLINLATGMLVVPFFLFSATAGQLADKMEKSWLIQKIKLVEVVLMVFASVGFLWGNVYFLLGVLFLMGAQSAFFGPLKYAILPDHLEEDELIGGNGIVEAGTFLAILFGIIAGGILIMTDHGSMVISALIVVAAVAGWLASRWIPKSLPPIPSLKVNLNFIQETYWMLRDSRKNRVIFLAILGISWFWLFGTVIITQFTTYTKEFIGGSEQVSTLMFGLFSIGIGIGSLVCNRLLGGEVKATYAPLGAFGMTFFVIDIYRCSQVAVLSAGGEYIGIYEFLSTIGNYRVIFDLFMLSLCGGIYIVPLYTLLQSRGDPEHRARDIACSNIYCALFMVLGTVITMGLFAWNFSITEVWLIIGLLNAGVGLIICGLLPLEIARAIIKTVVGWLFHVEVRGLENYRAAGKKALIIANHTSYLDAILLPAFLPDRLNFAINTHVANVWWVRMIIQFVEAHPLDPLNPMATKRLVDILKQDNRCVIFPEGRITSTGALMKIYEGPAIIADRADAYILPVHIEGAQFSYFSRLKGKLKLKMLPKVTMTILPPRKLKIPEGVKGKERRAVAHAQLCDIMTEMVYWSSDRKETLFRQLRKASEWHGGSLKIIEDIARKPMSYNDLIAKSLTIGQNIAKVTQKGEYVGILLPNSTTTVGVFFGLQSIGRVPAMLNFSSGVKNVLSACKIAQLKKVYTSRQFLEQANLEALAEAIKGAGCEVMYLEDLAKDIGMGAKIKGLASYFWPDFFYKEPKISPSDPAVVLFTSGSEGTPKGVVLSHENILSNIAQLCSQIDFVNRDIVFNALPTFHSYGLTVGMILPILKGMKLFLYPTPLHYRMIPEFVYDTQATIMFGTDTFLSGYAKYAHAFDFQSLRYIFAGAEKLRDQTRDYYAERFGARVFEGYGVTETSPVLAVNTPMSSKPGTVGRAMPDTEIRVEPVEGVEEGGRLFVKGPNVMKGYLLESAPGEIVPPKDGWHDTGDIVAVDDEGFIKILGRAKRFAKIGGEMVSLAAVESYLSKLWPNCLHAVVALKDDKKGEQIVAVTDYKEAARDAITYYAKENGISAISVPKELIIVDEIPILGTGKIDYNGVSQLVSQKL